MRVPCFRRSIELVVLVAAASATGSPQEYPARYSGEQLRADFAVFRDAMEEAHSGLYVFREPAEMTSVFEHESTVLDGGSEWELYRAVARVISEMQDGHTRVFLSEAAERFIDTSDAFLPFEIRILGERAFLTRDYTEIGSPDMLGSEIVAMDSRPWVEVETIMLDHLASDGASKPGERRLLENPRTFGRLYQILFGPRERYRLVLDQRGARRSVDIAALPWRRVDAIETRRYGDSEPRFRLSFPEEPSATAILRIGGFYGEGYTEFIEDAFRQISERSTRRLVIDLRNNGGGVESFGQRLVAHLTREPFDFYNRAVVNQRSFPTLRLSDRAGHTYSPLDAIDSGGGRLLLTEAFHDFLGETSPLNPIFDGDVYVLADGGSFSTTTDTMTRLHQMGRAVFVGTEAGGSYYGNTSGGTANLTLPHTKLRVRIPLERFYNNAAGYTPRDRGLIPDHVVEPTVDDVLASRDAALEAVFDLIRAEIEKRSGVP